MASSKDIRRKYVEFTQYIAPDGQVYRFDTHDKFLMSITGMGMSPLSYITQRGPFQHGETAIDYRLNKRVIQLVHRRNECSRDGYWNIRADMVNLLRPNRQTIGDFSMGALRIIMPDGRTRDIDVIIEQGPVFAPRNPMQWDEWGFIETVRFVAHDPTFYDPTEVTETWVLAASDQLVFNTVGGALDTLVFRKDGVGDGLLFGAGVIDDDLTVNYTGTWLSFPTIEIDGPMSGFIITNITTGEFIRLDYVIPAGEMVTITLEYGNKTVINDTGVNLIGTVTTDSDLSTFHIAPDPEATGGVNTINVLGGNTDGNTEVRLSYLTRYIGI